jgi:hypothetical protein
MLVIVGCLKLHIYIYDTSCNASRDSSDPKKDKKHQCPGVILASVMIVFLRVGYSICQCKYNFVFVQGPVVAELSMYARKYVHIYIHAGGSNRHYEQPQLYFHLIRGYMYAHGVDVP